MPKHGGPARQSGLSPAGEAATAEIEELGDALLLGPLTAVDAAKKEQAKAAAAMMRKGRKKDGRGASQPKKRRRGPSSSFPKSPRKPPKPPPPPESLIKLLQRDKSLQAYFQSLQDNLVYDVSTWKAKAEKFERELTSMKRRASSGGNGEEGDTEETCNKGGVNAGIRGEDGVDLSAEIHDAMFEENFSSSSSSSSADSDLDSIFSVENMEGDKSVSKRSKRKSVQRTQPPLQNGLGRKASETAAEKEQSEYNRNALLANLKEAYQCMEQLGVSLVVEDGDEKRLGTTCTIRDVLESSEKPDLEAVSGTNKQGGDPEKIFYANKDPDKEKISTVDDGNFSFTRRPDEAVAANLIGKLRCLVRVSSLIGDSDLASKYRPFSLDGAYLPCSSALRLEDASDGLKSHPAANGFRLACRALAIMDTYCGLSSDSWDGIFESKTGDDEMLFKAMKTGLSKRHRLAESIILTASEEIVSSWAVGDRSLRDGKDILRFESSNGDEIVEKESASVREEDEIEADEGLITFDHNSFSRLASLADRIILAKMVSELYQQRGEFYKAARLVIEYVVCTTPSEIEDHPCFPPVLSMCIVEALLHQYHSDEKSWFSGCLRDIDGVSASNTDGDRRNHSLLGRALSLSFGVAVKTWKIRLTSTDKRIRDISAVELAAFKRVFEREASWIDPSVFMDENTESVFHAKDITKDSIRQAIERSWCGFGRGPLLAVKLSLIVSGDIILISSSIDSAVCALKRAATGSQNDFPFWAISFASICCDALAVLQSYRLQPQVDKRESVGERNLLDPAIDKIMELVERKESNQDHQKLFHLQLASGIARCAFILADGNRMYQVVRWVSMAVLTMTSSIQDSTSYAKAFASLIDLISFPTVRVINLDRRRDRWINMFDQSRRAQLLLVKAVAFPDKCHAITDESKGYCWGNHAFDGGGSVLDLERSLSQDFVTDGDFTSATSKVLADFVSTHWYPNELAAFDKFARKDDAAVMMSLSERACALSHIGSWEGVFRSLVTPSSFDQSTSGHSDVLMRLFRISGFATGPALFHENKNLPPMPVCIILEDDAVLVDHFADRLGALLHELPRDFHFCSLGYGRPKNAPMFRLSEHVGIPSFLWYLTGYVLSFEGAKKLLGELPVVGPVDSWIGLKLCSNWDNAYGHSLGVGRETRKNFPMLSTLPTRKDLAKIMKFRAFAANVPLCSQVISSTKASPSFTKRASWRNRDTDITYSGF